MFLNFRVRLPGRRTGLQSGSDPLSRNLIVRRNGKNLPTTKDDDLRRLVANARTLFDMARDLALATDRNEVHGSLGLNFAEPTNFAVCVKAGGAGGTVLENDAEILRKEGVVMIGAGQFSDNRGFGMPEMHYHPVNHNSGLFVGWTTVRRRLKEGDGGPYRTRICDLYRVKVAL